MTHVHHTIDYVELGVGEQHQQVRSFYATVFAWTYHDYGPDYSGICWVTGDEEVGGLDAGRPGGRGGPLVLLWSSDLDATLAAVVAAGGEVSSAPVEFPGGRRFRFLDPAGNELGVWSDH